MTSFPGVAGFGEDGLGVLVEERADMILRSGVEVLSRRMTALPTRSGFAELDSLISCFGRSPVVVESSGLAAPVSQSVGFGVSNS